MTSNGSPTNSINFGSKWSGFKKSFWTRVADSAMRLGYFALTKADPTYHPPLSQWTPAQTSWAIFVFSVALWMPIVALLMSCGVFG